MIKKTFHISGMHCTSCNFLIEDALEEIGVKATASYQKGTVDVSFDEHSVTEQLIENAIKKAGYTRAVHT